MVLRIALLACALWLAGLVRPAAADTITDTCLKAADRNARITACTQLIQTSKDKRTLVGAYNTRGLALCTLNRCAEAISDFENVLSRNSAIAGFFDNYARALRDAHRFDDSLKAEEHAIRMAPKYAFLYYGKAKTFEAMGDISKALATAEEALHVEPNNAGIWEYRGKLFGLQSRFAEAYASIDRALSIEPSRSHVFITRADIELLQGRKDAALADLRRYPPDGDSYQEARQKIAEMIGDPPAAQPIPLAARPSAREANQPLPALQQGSYWLVLASRQSLNQAIGAATAFGGPTAKVMHSVNGWYAAVSGPHRIADGQNGAFLNKEKTEHGVPADAYLTTGVGLDKIAWQPPGDSVELKLDYDGEHDVSARRGNLRLELSKRLIRKDEYVPVLTGYFRDRQAFREELGEENPGEKPAASVRLAMLDLGSVPDIVFTYYWQGAHCCTLTKIISLRKDGVWSTVSLGPLDGDGAGLEKLAGNNFAYLISIDQNFLYAFASYAGSFGAIRIQQLSDGQLLDVTRQPRLRDRIEQDVFRQEAFAKQQDELKTNGFLAGWVANKILIGEGDDAWRTMLVSYEHDDNGFGVDRCLINLPVSQCPEAQKVKLPFPEGLRQFLNERGYIGDLERYPIPRAVPLPPPPTQPSTAYEAPASPSSQIGTCTAVFDTVKQLVYRVFMGRQSRPDDDYGAVHISNDATLEDIDDRTGKVTCAVSYEFDVRPFIGLLAEQGNFAQAQNLSRLMRRRGSSLMTNRVRYTVKPTATAGTSYIELLR